MHRLRVTPWLGICHPGRSTTFHDLYVILYLLLEGGTVEESPAAPWPSPLPSQEGRGAMLVLVTPQVEPASSGVTCEVGTGIVSLSQEVGVK